MFKAVYSQSRSNQSHDRVQLSVISTCALLHVQCVNLGALLPDYSAKHKRDINKYEYAK